MEATVRYFVQVHLADKGWKVYCPKGHARKGRYTLTEAESTAYLATLPVEGKYRVVKSVEADGLITQEVVGYQIP